MAQAFNAPNPYGSYFSFQNQYGGVDPTPSLWRQPNYPAVAPMSSGVAAAMGSPSGGFNPTEREFENTRRRDIAFQQFIDNTIKNDPRVRTVGNMVMDGIYGKDMQARAGAMARIGGPDAYAGLVGTFMNVPGISGYFGGSARSLAVGSLAAATSGLTMNGYGVYGDKGLNMRFADSLMSKVTSQFYGANGNAVLGMTNGMNRDQLGGIMVQAASQGAFSGMNMGTLQKMDSAGRNVKFVSDDATVNKITEFMKQTTKALSSLIDVYGNISSGELMQKAQQITGLDLSRLGNAKLMGDRLSRLRDTARVTGIDTQSMFDMAARSSDYLTGIGLRPELAGSFGGIAAIKGMQDYRSRQQNVHNFYTNSISPMEAIQAAGRDLAGMSQDPIGARLAALEMAIGHSGMDATAASALRSKASGLAANGAGVGMLDQLGRSALGVNLPALINTMGGASALQQQLSPEQQEHLGASLMTNFRPRQIQMIQSKLFRGGLMSGGSAAQLNTMTGLVSNFDNDTIERLLSAKSGDVMGLIRGGGFNEAEAAGMMGDVNSIRGMGARGVAAYHATRSMMQSNEFLRTFTPESLRRKNAYMSLNPGELGSDFRGGMLGNNFVAGMLDRYTGDDPAGQLRWLGAVAPGKLAGIHESISMDFGSFRSADNTLNEAAWRKNVLNWRTGLERTPEGHAVRDRYNLNAVGGSRPDLESAALHKFYDDMSNPDTLAKVMQPFSVAATAGGRNILFGSKADLARKGQYGASGEVLFDLARDAAKSSPGEALFLEQAANAQIQGLWFGADVKNGRLNKYASARASRALNDQFNDPAFMAHHILGQLASGGTISADTLSAIGRTSAGGTISQLLNDRQAQLEQVLDPTLRKKNQPMIDEIKAIKDKLSLKSGATQKMNPNGKIKLEGTLSIQRDGAGAITGLKLNDDAMMNAASLFGGS